MVIVHLIIKPEYRKFKKHEHGTVQYLFILSCPRISKLSMCLGTVGDLLFATNFKYPFPLQFNIHNFIE